MNAVHRSIYYLGNKAKSAKEIVEKCEYYSREGDYYLDLFAGSGAVSAELSRFSKVFTNDVQSYSRIICDALLNGTEDDSSKFKGMILSENFQRSIASKVGEYAKYIDDEYAVAKDTVAGNLGTEQRRSDLVGRLFQEADIRDPIIRNYGGVYFTVRDACALQVLYDVVLDLPAGQRMIGYACLLSAASRGSVTVGNQFAQPQKFSDSEGRAKVGAGKVYLSSFDKNIVDYVIAACEIYPVRGRHSGGNRCIQGIDAQVARDNVQGAKLVYLDPPYGREHYSRFYHVLEDLAVGEFASSAKLRTRMRDARYQSEYSIRSKAPGAFKNILDICGENGVPIAISYVDESFGSPVENRIVSIDFLRNLVKERYNRVYEFPISYKKYSQMNKIVERDGRSSVEVLIMGVN